MEAEKPSPSRIEKALVVILLVKWWCAFKGTDFGPEAYGMAFLQYYYVSYRISTDYADIGSWNS